MAEFAPATPKTEDLRELHPQPIEEHERIQKMRRRTSAMLGECGTGLLVVIGPCGLTDEAVHEGIIEQESRELAARNAAGDSNALWLHRMPDWKPRSNKKDWHGLITSNPELAYRTLRQSASTAANVAIEINTDGRHLKRNSDSLTLAWKGGRNDTEAALTEALALHDPSLPVAVKNGLDGEVDLALADVDKITQLRRGMGANAALLYRGGLNAQNPKDWEEHYLRTHERTNGLVIVDAAHGGEQAHDPEGNFGKSIEGQVRALDHIIDVAERTGITPAGVFIEASDHPGRTDPNMPFALAIERAEQIAKLNIAP